MEGQQYCFSKYSLEYKIKTLARMEQYLQDKPHFDAFSYYTDWAKMGVTPGATLEETLQKYAEVASDDTRYVNALFGFYSALCTPLPCDGNDYPEKAKKKRKSSKKNKSEDLSMS
jgi:hypothetical protein